jgi:hypothetical protein
MNDTHLTSDQLQNYLDNTPGIDRKSVEAHLGICEHCRMELKRYEKLYTVLGEDRGFELNPGFAQRVITELSTAEEKSKRSWYVDAVIPVIGVLASIAVVYYFIGWGMLKSSFVSYLKPQWMFFTGLYNQLTSSISSYGVEEKFILPAVAIIVLTAFADYLIKNRHKLLSASQNRMFV